MNYLARFDLSGGNWSWHRTAVEEASLVLRPSRKQQNVDLVLIAFSIFVVIVILGWIGYLTFAY
jgi:hypothetical protein